MMLLTSLLLLVIYSQPTEKMRTQRGTEGDTRLVLIGFKSLTNTLNSISIHGHYSNTVEYIIENSLSIFQTKPGWLLLTRVFKLNVS